MKGTTITGINWKVMFILFLGFLALLILFMSGILQKMIYGISLVLRIVPG